MWAVALTQARCLQARLTFKDNGELWIGTKESTRKVGVDADASRAWGGMDRGGMLLQLGLDRSHCECVMCACTRADVQLQFGQIHAVSSEPIESNKDYAIMRLQLDSAGKQNYFLYFVPAQYTASIKRMLGG